MAWGGLPWNGLKVTFKIDIKLLNIIIMNQKLENIVRSPTGVYNRPTFIPDVYKWFTYGL